jgi:type IV secretion system protein VirB6
MFSILALASPSLGDLSNFVFYDAIKDFLLADDGLVTQWTADMAVRMGELMALVALPMLTAWIMFHGYRILTGQSREPMMVLVTHSACAMLIVFIATAASLGNPWIAAKIGELGDLISVMVTGNKNMGGQVQESLGWMQFAFSSIDALPTGDDAAVATAKDRALWFTGIGTASPSLIGGIMLILFEIVIKFLIAMGPLAIMCLLFERTKAIFQHWLQYCVSSLFRLATTAVMTAIAMKMVCAVAAAFWADKLLNAAVQQLSGGAIDLHMAEGITSMALQQGGLGVILSVLIVTVPQMTAQFFMGALGSFMHYSNFGGTGGGNTQPGPQGQPIGSYQGSQPNLGRTTAPNYDMPPIPNSSSMRPRLVTDSTQDVIKSSSDVQPGAPNRPPDRM